MRNDFCLIAKHMEVTARLTGNTAPVVSFGVSQTENTVSIHIWILNSLSHPFEVVYFKQDQTGRSKEMKMGGHVGNRFILIIWTVRF